MKQRIFTLIALAALVLIGGNVMAQSTLDQPFEGSTFTYTVDVLTTDDEYAFIVTDDLVTSDPVASAIASGTTFTFGTTNTNSGTIGEVQAASDTAKVDITWNSGAAVGGPYNLWIQITRSGCSNYRYVVITPQANTIDFAVLSLGSGLSSADASGLTVVNDATEFCATPEDPNYLQGASYDNGSTYIYFKVTRTNGVTANDWDFNITALTFDGTPILAANVEFSTDGSSSWSAEADFSDIVVTAQDVIYGRFLVDPLTDATRTTVITIDNMLEDGTGLSELAAANTNNTTTNDLSPTPTTGTFLGF